MRLSQFCVKFFPKFYLSLLDYFRMSFTFYHGSSCISNYSTCAEIEKGLIVLDKLWLLEFLKRNRKISM